jgi:hypothetical protein
VLEQMGSPPRRQPAELDDIDRCRHHRQRRTRMAIMSRELFNQTHSTIASLFAEITASHTETTGFSLDAPSDEVARGMLSAIRAAAEFVSPDYAPIPANLSQQRHAAILEGHVDASNVREILVGEWHIFVAFIHEGTSSVRLRLGTLLCAYYARLGFKNHAYAMMSLLHRVGCLLRFGATPRKDVVVDGGMLLYSEDLASHWDDVLAIVVEIRSHFDELTPATTVKCFARPQSGEPLIKWPKACRSKAQLEMEEAVVQLERKYDLVSMTIDPLTGDLTPSLRLRASVDEQAFRESVSPGFEHYFEQVNT